MTAIKKITDGNGAQVYPQTSITAVVGSGSNIPFVNHGTSDTTFALTPNVFHIWGNVASLTLTLAASSYSSMLSRYMFQFTSGYTATTLSLPSSVRGDITIESGKVYQIVIINNVAQMKE